MFDSHMLFLTVLLIILLLLSAFFSGSETALMAVSKLRLRHLAQTKPRSVRLVERLLLKPERLIGTILLGNNLVNVAMSAVATFLAISFWGEAGIVYVTAILTVIILIFAEITPKVYAKNYSEPVSFVVAPLLFGIMAILSPVVTAVTFLTNRLLLLFGMDVSKVKRPLYTEDIVQTCIKMSYDDGAISPDEKNMLSRVFTLNDIAVERIMVPKDRMVTLDLHAREKEVIRTILKTGHTRFPVEENHEILGFVHAKDLFKMIDAGTPIMIGKVLRPPYFIPASRKIDAQLRSFQRRKLHQAIVLDPSGEVAGLITLEDIIEELVGAIRDEHDD
jgi:putative hemolysin